MEEERPKIGRYCSVRFMKPSTTSDFSEQTELMSGMFFVLLAIATSQIPAGALCPSTQMVTYVPPHRDASSTDGEWVGDLNITSTFKIWVALTLQGLRATYRTQLSETRSGTTARRGANVAITLPDVQFTGKLSSDGIHLAGVWIRKGASPVGIDLIRHPQTPVPPYSYLSEEVQFVGIDGHNLAGTLTLPKRQGTLPAVILAVGSVPADRDYLGMSENPSHRIFAVLADNLTRHGFAVLRFDQRGTGGSGNDPIHATEAQLETDIEAGIGYLARRPEIDPRHIGMIGHSGGGIRTIRLMKDDPRIAFGVLLASPAAPMLDFAAWQADRQARALGLDVDRRNKMINATLALAKAVLPATSYNDAKTRIDIELAKLKAEGGHTDPITQLLDEQWLATEPYRFLLSYDPQPDLRQIHKPMLAIVPGADQRINPAQALPALKQGLANNQQAEICVLPGVNHNLQHTGTGTTVESSRVLETINPAVLTLLDHWIEREAIR